MYLLNMALCLFQHTAARRRLGFVGSKSGQMVDVSTHSRPKAAGSLLLEFIYQQISFNTQPPEGGWISVIRLSTVGTVSTHSRPKAAGAEQGFCLGGLAVSTHSRPKAAGFINRRGRYRPICFNTQPPEGGWVSHPWSVWTAGQVSTHSRPKAAGGDRQIKTD